MIQTDLEIKRSHWILRILGLEVTKQAIQINYKRNSR
jgi:hypothetical protein